VLSRKFIAFIAANWPITVSKLMLSTFSIGGGRAAKVGGLVRREGPMRD